MAKKTQFKQSNTEILSCMMQDFFSIQEWKNIIQFAVEDIDLSGDVSADRPRIDLDFAPYLVEPMSCCTIEQSKRKEVVISFPEQMGKTLIEMVALLYNTVYNELQAIICYPSIELAVQTSTVKFIPLFKKIEQFKEEIEKPFAIRSDRLKLSNALIYWQGAGSPIVSRSSKLVLGDQCSVWATPHNINNLNELKKRTRSYNQCLQLFVSTPKYKQDFFWRQWVQGSQGYYYLRCQHCGELTMRSCDIHNLQFDTVFNDELKQYVAVRGSQRLICPQCHYQHPESQREALIKQGAYIHNFPDRCQLYPTFQAGVLASLLNVHCWSNIADIQLSSGKTATLQDYISFDNSIRGLPYQQRQYNKQSETALSKHYYTPEDLDPESIQAVIIAADTQDTFSPYAVVALTKENNYYVLDIGRLRYLWLQDNERAIINAENQRNGKPREITLLDLLDKEYHGIKPLCMLVDERGHRADQIKQFAKMRKNILMYGGTNLKYQKWKPSENIKKLFLCDAKKFQSELIFMLHFNQSKESNYIFLPQLSTEDAAEILSFQPDAEKRNGNLYENWTPKDKVHDMFDTLKMSLAAFQIAAKIYRKDRFIHGQAKILQSTKAAKRKPAPVITPPRKKLFWH